MTNNNSKVIYSSFPKKGSNASISKLARQSKLFLNSLKDKRRSSDKDSDSKSSEFKTNVSCSSEIESKSCNNDEPSCPICYSIDDNMSEKFKCSHKVCDGCFRHQIEKSSSLSCCFCRSDIDCNKLSGNEKELVKERINDVSKSMRDNITEILLTMNGIDGSIGSGDFPNVYPAWMDVEIGNSSPLLDNF